MPDLLRLVALDSEDLAVLSANLQDALIKTSDMAYFPSMKRFALVASRFDWLRAASQGAMERCRAGMHFERVLKVSRMGFDQRNAELVLNLLSVTFSESDPPAGHVTLTFSGGAAVRLDVECLEAQMRDIGPRWKAKGQPGHQLDDVG
jgi:hypothetical protein